MWSLRREKEERKEEIKKEKKRYDDIQERRKYQRIKNNIYIYII